MNAPDRDAEFEAFLKRRTLLPERPDMLGKLEPPARLDEAVLNQARTAIHAQRQPVRAARWARPVALAATILLCLSIVLNVTLNTNRPAVYRERATVAGADQAAGQVPAPPPPAVALRDMRGQPGSAGPPGGSQRVAGEAGSRGQPGTARPPKFAPTAEAAPAAPAPVAPDSDALQGEPAAARAFAAAPRAPSQMRTDPAAGTPQYSADAMTKPATPPLMARSGNSALTTRPSASAESTSGARQAPLSADAGGPAAAVSAPSDAASAAGSTHAPQAAADAAASTRAPQVAMQPRDETTQQSSEPTSAGGGLQALKPTALAKRKSDAQAPHPQDPKVWLQQIEALRSQGKTAQADAEMQRFRAAFPDYPAQPGDSGTR